MAVAEEVVPETYQQKWAKNNPDEIGLAQRFIDKGDGDFDVVNYCFHAPTKAFLSLYFLTNPKWLPFRTVEGARVTLLPDTESAISYYITGYDTLSCRFTVERQG
jgi:hypothetical protein